MLKTDASPTGDLDIERLAPGMATQLGAFHAALARGMPRLGWKVGVNVPEVQAALGLRHSLVGWLDGAAVAGSGAHLAVPEGMVLHVEPELALEVGGPVSSTASSAEARAAITAVAPAFEIVDYLKGGHDLDELLAHSMFHKGTVLGDFQVLPNLVGAGFDWPTLRKNGKRVGVARDDLVPREVGAIVVSIARTLDAFGERLAPGDLILTGSFMERALRLDPGAHVTAEFGPLGSIELWVAGRSTV